MGQKEELWGSEKKWGCGAAWGRCRANVGQLWGNVGQMWGSCGAGGTCEAVAAQSGAEPPLDDGKELLLRGAAVGCDAAIQPAHRPAAAWGELWGAPLLWGELLWGAPLLWGTTTMG